MRWLATTLGLLAVGWLSGCMHSSTTGDPNAEFGEKYGCSGTVVCDGVNQEFERKTCIRHGEEQEFFELVLMEIADMGCTNPGGLHCQGPSTIAPVPCLLEE